MHQNINSQQSSRSHPRDAGMVQYTEIHQCNTLHKKKNLKEKDHMVISLDAEKAFDKI